MSKIGRPKTMASRKQVSLTPELEATVEEFRFTRRFKTESDAIRHLIELGIGAEPHLRALLELLDKPPYNQEPDQAAQVEALRRLLRLSDPSSS